MDLCISYNYFFLNKLPSKALHFEIPYQFFYRKELYFTLLYSFGCLYYPCLRYFNKHKLQPRLIQCVFLGYVPQQRDYLCFDRSSGKLYKSRHVKFDESFFLTILFCLSLTLLTLTPSLHTPWNKLFNILFLVFLMCHNHL